MLSRAIAPLSLPRHDLSVDRVSFFSHTVLIATDKFKGTLSSLEVARALADGFAEAGVATTMLEVADGGEGTARALVAASGGTISQVEVSGPLGEPVRAEIALLADGKTAVIDAAQAAGLWRLPGNKLDPWRATTTGVGELVGAAAQAGAELVIVAPGGTASVDGGAGAVEVVSRLRRRPRIRVACDVRTVWEDAARVFGPQKGADASMVTRLERRLDALARSLPRDPRGVAMTGCGGGLSGGLWAGANAELVPGAALVLDQLDFDTFLSSATLVVTGEGQIDEQTAEGKLVGEVARRTSRASVPCVAAVGRNAIRDGGSTLGLTEIVEAGTPELLRALGRRLGNLNW